MTEAKASELHPAHGCIQNQWEHIPPCRVGANRISRAVGGAGFKNRGVVWLWTQAALRGVKVNTVQKGNTGDEWQIEMELLDLAMARHAQVFYPCGAGHAYGGPIPSGYAELIMDAAAGCHQLGDINHRTWEVQVKWVYLGVGVAAKCGGPPLTGVRLTKAAQRMLAAAAKQQQDQKVSPPEEEVVPLISWLKKVWRGGVKLYGNWNAKRQIKLLFPVPYVAWGMRWTGVTPVPVKALPDDEHSQAFARYQEALSQDPYRALGVEPTVH